MLSAVDGVAQFETVQDGLDHVGVLIVRTRGLGAEVFGGMEARLNQTLRRDVWVEIVVCGRISIEASGKFRYVFSRVFSN